MHVSAAMYIRHRDKPGYLTNAIMVCCNPPPLRRKILTEVDRPGTGVRPIPRHLEAPLLTIWLVASTGLRDSDNLWFDGMTGCQVSDKV